MGYSTLLFGSPSFLEGFGRAIDAGGILTEFNSSMSARQADYFALWSDWAVVGADIREAAKSQYWKAIREQQERQAEKK